MFPFKLEQLHVVAKLAVAQRSQVLEVGKSLFTAHIDVSRELRVVFAKLLEWGRVDLVQLDVRDAIDKELLALGLPSCPQSKV